MSDIEHPSKGHHDDEDEQVSLVPSTVGFAISAVVALVGMFLVLFWNYHGGF